METNETIVNKQVVSLGDAGQIGTVCGLAINPAARAIGHYLIETIAGEKCALPFDKALSVGDTFLIMQSNDDLVPADDIDDDNDGVDLVGLNVFSSAGDKIGGVVSYEVDTIYGDVTRLVLDDDSEFTADDFVFFSPKFIFVDDGSKTDAELRGIANRANRGMRGVVNPLGEAVVMRRSA